MKLTAAIAASYFGAEYTVDTDSIVRKVNWRFFQLIDVLSNPKLILTPLDKISDDDAVDVAKILDYPQNEINDSQVLTDTIVEHLEDVFNGNSATYSDYVSGNTFIVLIDYLRSKSYDCGHGSIPNLIAAGVAVAKEIV